MSVLPLLKERFSAALEGMVGDEERGPLLDLIRASKDPKFGDYQANFAMPLGKKLGQPPRDIAAQIIEQLTIDDICEAPEVAGPGFINLKIKNDWLISKLEEAGQDSRLGIKKVEKPMTCVVDYSAPNAAKPMHVGHIRSTVIGDSICRTLRFVGHHVISDNHIGDWGTQFGMIIYGYRHFLDAKHYEEKPVEELARLYRLVRQLVDYHAGKAKLPEMKEQLEKKRELYEQKAAEAGEKPDKKTKKSLRKLESSANEDASAIASIEKSLFHLNSKYSGEAETIILILSVFFKLGQN